MLETLPVPWTKPSTLLNPTQVLAPVGLLLAALLGLPQRSLLQSFRGAPALFLFMRKPSAARQRSVTFLSIQPGR
jgi:hypothetical protein